MSEYEEPSVPPEDVLRPRLDVLASHTLARASEIWGDVGGGFEFVEARFRVLDAQASRAAFALYDLDKESRRSVRVIAGRGRFEPAIGESPRTLREVQSARGATSRGLLRPTRIEYGGFTVLRAEPGSAEFLLDAYGLLSSVLLADPLQFVLTLKAILGYPAQVVLRRWPLGRSGTPAVRHLDEEVQFEGGDLRVGAHLPPGSRLRLRYKGAGGDELEIDLETPG